MTITISVSEARASLSELVERVRAGEEVVLTRHGVEMVVMVRPDVFRARRVGPAHAAAAELRELLDDLRDEPLASAPRLSPEQTEALVAEVRASRESR